MPVRGLEKIEINDFYTVRTMPVQEAFYVHPRHIYFFSQFIVVKLDDYVYADPIEDYPEVEIIKTSEGVTADNFVINFHENTTKYPFFFMNDEVLNEFFQFKENYLWFSVTYPEDMFIVEPSQSNNPEQLVPAVLTIEDILSQKEEQLNTLVADQEFEQAAKIRDEILEIKKEKNTNPQFH